jgi:ribosomal protein S6--L-glutamate ligase
MKINTQKSELYLRGQSLGDYDAVIPRIGASVSFYGTAVVRQFEMMGVYCLNSSAAISRSRDKLYAHQILSQANLPMPITGFAHHPDDTRHLIKIMGGAPMVLKLLEGTQGKGVVLAETAKAANSVIGAFRHLNANLLIQEFLKESAGEDYRCFVIGNKVVASMMRKAPEGEFRSNLHQGGAAFPVKVTREERTIAIRAARALGLQVAGVDMMRTSQGPKILEVNSSPGLEGIENATGKNIADLMIAHIEKNRTCSSKFPLSLESHGS